MDRLAHPATSRTASTTPAPGLEHMPQDVLQHILHYLPVKTTRNAFKLINRNYLNGTDYLRIAGMVQTRIRNKVTTESWEQAERRLEILIDDCMDSAFPAALRHSLVMELIGTLPQLPAALHADAMQFVLAQCNAIGEQSGPATRQACMTLCIHAYQRRSECEPQLEKFWPVTDEEVRIAADFFAADIDPAFVPFPQILNHMDSLLAAMDNVNSMQDSEAGDRALTMLCNHCTDTFSVIDGGTEMLRKNAGWEHIADLKTAFASKALLLFPGKSVACQAALLSVTLAFAGKNSAMRKQAEIDGRDLIVSLPGAMLPLELVPLATSLFRQDVVKLLIERVEAWTDPVERLAMIRQLATAAWEKGEMSYMEDLCASISRLDPPDAVALKTLMQSNMQLRSTERLEFATRDVIPYLLCVPTGLSRVAALDTLGRLMAIVPDPAQGMKAQQRLAALRLYSLNAHGRLISTYYRSNERELERIADAANSPAGAASLATHPAINAILEAAMRVLEQPRSTNAKPRSNPDV